jgi:hypothetical protein
MNDPVAEIPTAINLCAGAGDADSQVSAFHKYFTPDASFLHPLCYVPSRPHSLQRVIGIFLFYRGVIPHARFDIQAVAFDARSGKLFVQLLQSPWIRGWSWIFCGWRPVVPIHIIFHLRRVNGKWYIDEEENTVQPMVSVGIPLSLRWARSLFLSSWLPAERLTGHFVQSVLLAIPPLRPLAYAFYWLCELLGLLNGWLFIVLGIWRPEQHLRHSHKAD